MKNKKMFLIPMLLALVMFSYVPVAQALGLYTNIIINMNNSNIKTTVGPNLEEGSSGFFGFVAGDKLPYMVTYNNKNITGYSIKVGDIVQMNISAVNNTYRNMSGLILPDMYDGDMLFGGYIFYNSTSGQWEDPSSTNVVLACYNSTTPFTNYVFAIPFPTGKYYCFNVGTIIMWFGYPFAPFPRNFTATNNTIVNMSQILLASYSDKTFWFNVPVGTIEGTWQVGVGSPVESNASADPSMMIELVIDNRGIVTRERIYENGTSYWELGYELTFQGLERPTDSTMLLLLLLYKPPLDYTLPIIIAVVIFASVTLGVVLYTKREDIFIGRIRSI